VPRISSDGSAKKVASVQKQDDTNKADRVRQAFALLLWQKSLPKPELDVVAFEKVLAEIIGKDSMEILVSLPEAERESMRFSAERLHGTGLGVKREVQALLSVLQREQLSGRLAAASAALKTAEAEGNEAEVERLMTECKLLTGQIAKQHTAV